MRKAMELPIALKCRECGDISRHMSDARRHVCKHMIERELEDGEDGRCDNAEECEGHRRRGRPGAVSGASGRKDEPEEQTQDEASA